MAIMQPQANRERIIIRTALAPDLPPVVADARSIRQIVLNLLSNSIKFTAAGRPGDRLDRAHRRRRSARCAFAIPASA